MKNSKVTKKKREEFLKKKNTYVSKQFIAIAAVVAFFVTFVIGAYVVGGKQSGNGNGSFSGSKPVEMSPVKAVQADGYLKLSLGEVKERGLVFFEYDKVQISDQEGNQKSLPLQAYVAPSGRVVTAVSICEPCSSYYFHIEQGNTLVCNVCGTRWNLENLSAISGACGSYPPLEVPNEIEGDTIKIAEADIASWKPRD